MFYFFQEVTVVNIEKLVIVKGHEQTQNNFDKRLKGQPRLA